MRKILLTLCIAAATAVQAALPSTSPLNNVQMTGSANQVNSGATLTVKSGGTFVFESGATGTFPSGFLSWASVSKSGSSLADLATRAATDLTGTLGLAHGGTGGTTAITALDSLITPEATVASATTTDLGAATSRNVTISGTTTITSFGTATAGVMRFGRFSGALLLTYNATSLILPTAASITTVAGDTFIATSLGSGNWRVNIYARGDGTAIAGATGTVTATGGSLTSNRIVLGAGSSDTKTAAGLSTDGTSQLNLGVAGTSVGKLVLANGTSGTVTIQPVTGALGSAVISAPAVTDTMTTIAATQSLSAKQYAHTAAHGTDDTYEGANITGLNAGATIAQWEAVYLGSSSTWLLADANGSGTYPARGLAVAAYSSTNPAVILIVGTVRNDGWSWTPGGTIYLSTTAGALTQTAPTTSGDKVQQVGFALTSHIAWFNFASGEYLTVQ